MEENSGFEDYLDNDAKDLALAKSGKMWKSKPSVTFDGYSDDWPPRRKQLGKLFGSKAFDLSVGAIIFFNMGLLVVETDAQSTSSDGSVPEWIDTVNKGLVVFYIGELSIRIFVYRSAFFRSLHNWADMVIVICDVVLEIIILVVGSRDSVPSIVFLRIFRLVRFGRTHRALIMFPELNILVLGLAGAFKAIFWGMILLGIVLMVWGILAVQIIQPLNLEVHKWTDAYDACERCPRAFETVFDSLVTFTQQIIAGDSWGMVSIPIIDRYPWTFFFFFAVLGTLGMTVLNLILAVVIDSSNCARQETDHQLAQIKEQEFKVASRKLLRICRDLDKDGNGTLTLPEVENGVTENQEFADAMRVLDIRPEDMETVFKILDTDQSGDVPYDEFVDELYKLKTYEAHTMLVFTRFYVTEIYDIVVRELALLKESVLMLQDVEGIETPELKRPRKRFSRCGKVVDRAVIKALSDSSQESPSGPKLKSNGPLPHQKSHEGTSKNLEHEIVQKMQPPSHELTRLQESFDAMMIVVNEIAQEVRGGRFDGLLDATGVSIRSQLSKYDHIPPPSTCAIDPASLLAHAPSISRTPRAHISSIPSSLQRNMLDVTLANSLGDSKRHSPIF